jgi:tyrosine-protein kinase Etk/Wzc
MVSSGVQASNIRIVDAAEVPKGPVKPKVFLNLALGVMLGLAVGLGLAFLQEYLDNTLKTADEVERLLRLPSLGLLPDYIGNGQAGADKLAIASHGNNGAVAPALQTGREPVEAYRTLRTSILLSANPVPKMLLITSALPSEGKTTVTINLGATLASLGSKVVIVDCDMRRPTCHRSTGVENRPGFVRCLTGHVGLEDAILPVPGVPNLSVIPCGPIPPNPAEVLSAPVTLDLLRRLRSEFEYVLLDSPPLLTVSDSRILSTLTDAVVLVTRAYSTPFDLVRRARGLLYNAGARILGVALNNVNVHKQGGSGYSLYRYGYGYGYGYEQDSSEESAGQSES